MDVGCVGKDATQVGDAGMCQRDHPVLALLERAEDPDLRRVPNPPEEWVRVGPDAGLSSGTADRHRNQSGNTKAGGVAARIGRLGPSFVGGRLQVVESPAGQDDVVDNLQQRTNVAHLHGHPGQARPVDHLDARQRQSEIGQIPGGGRPGVQDAQLDGRPCGSVQGRYHRRELGGLPTSRVDQDTDSSPAAAGRCRRSSHPRLVRGGRIGFVHRIHEPHDLDPRPLAEAGQAEQPLGREPGIQDHPESGEASGWSGSRIEGVRGALPGSG